MPLYELVCIAAHSPVFSPIKALTTITTSLVLANGGVVRNIDYHGLRNLPQIMKRGDGTHSIGDYWTMKFDANPPTVAALNERLRLDPRVIRWTTLKVGATLSAISADPCDPTTKFSRSTPPAAIVAPPNSASSGADYVGRSSLPGAPSGMRSRR